MGELSSAQMLGLDVCGSVSVVWVGCMCSLLPYGTGFCCYLFDFLLLLLVSVYSFFTVFFLNLVSVNQLEWSVVGAVLTYPGLFFFFFLKGAALNGLAA